MYRDTPGDAEPRRQRKSQSSRINASQAIRPERQRKKGPGSNSFGGMHRRKNKHWNW
jgi:hypothetical protein